MRKLLLASAALISLLAVPGCQTPPEMNVEHQWADTMRRLNMFGFYPPTEDVRLGSFYLHVPPRDGAPSMPQFSLRRLGSYRSQAVLWELRGQQQRDRMIVQPLPGLLAAARGAPPRRFALSSPSPSALVEDPNCQGYDIGHADDTRCAVRLQRAAVPALTVGRITAGQLGLAGIIGNVGARLGLGESSQTAVSISLRDVQELSLDAWRVSRLHNREGDDVLNLLWAENVLHELAQIRPELLEAACNGDRDRLASQRVEVLVITRIIYAGGLDYSFTRNAEAAVRLALDLQSTLPGQPQAPAIPSLASGTASGSANPATAASPDPAVAAGQRLAALLQGVTGESGTSGARAGATVSFGVGVFGAMSLKQDFNRPIAVGAGSRVSYALHDFISAPPNLPGPSGQSLAEQRFARASAYCAQAFPTRFRPDGLRRAMQLPERT